MNVADAMTPREDVVTAELPGTRSDVLEYLQEQSFSSVPVVKPSDGGPEYRGLISRDALIEQPDEDQLVMLMEDVPTTTAETSLEKLAETMVAEGARRVPVVDGEFEGIVTITDVIHAIATGDQATDGSVEAHATGNVNTTYEGAPLPVAERELYYANVPYTVALDDDGKMSGVLTEVDIIDVARIVEGEEATGDNFPDQDSEWSWEGIKAVGSRYLPTRDIELPAGSVSEFMTEDVVTVSGNTSIQETAQQMISNDVEQIPLVTAEQLAGIVRDVDLLEALYE
ncbi:CBS domain-containing protein [Natronobacterium gregoryi]|uniref:CBS domain-containing protein n=2 Tax=Natronobacterium gregoryi TaxID=44930 RepID=L0AFH4_NATGS|nr:CBS domain-containing protein [Natronobacterium gregoryi]AFZ72643.1 CBS domain-containing protein [Natronobacterium gregoryi SP2]ELY69068.1 CBS domain-containing protein [Natronobacterium gregoryi SP2]PLK19118.1 CBS domain-containing protein [Natronobacterium gregoryi SP2]SFI90512.1 CBS domain-containing protein [Natronobacterium gregoryi]